MIKRLDSELKREKSQVEILMRKSNSRMIGAGVDFYDDSIFEGLDGLNIDDEFFKDESKKKGD